MSTEPNRNNAPTEAHPASSTLADLREQVRALTRELAEAREQQTATSEILGAIAASPTNIQPVLEAIAENACRLCQAYDAIIFLSEGERLSVGAHHGPISTLGGGRSRATGWQGVSSLIEYLCTCTTSRALLPSFPMAASGRFVSGTEPLSEFPC